MNEKRGTSLKTYGDLVEQGYELVYTCRRCGDQGKLNPASFPPGQTYLRQKHYCVCPGELHVQLRPPGIPRMSTGTGRIDR